MNFKIIPSTNHHEWNHILSKAEQYDFYHTASYHQLDKSGESRLLVFEEDNNYLAIPFIFRKILNTPWHDVTSVYGYAGWLRSSQYFSPKIFNILEEYFRQENVVSAFSRLHPLIEGSDHFLRGNIETLNKTTAINLNLAPQIQFNSYSKSVQRFIKKRKDEISIRIATRPSDSDTFISIYQDAMKYLNASSQYYFPLNYFNELLNSTEFESFILLAEYENQVIGGALFVITNQIMEYHLGAIVPEYKHYSPLKLIIDQARLIGNKRNLSVLHLGGGYGGTNDNLFTFKFRMSTNQYPFKIWKWIVDESNYNELSIGKLNSSFFPLYRC